MRTLLLVALAWLARLISRAQLALTTEADHLAADVEIEILRDGVCIAQGVQVGAGYVGTVSGDVAKRLIELGFAKHV